MPSAIEVKGNAASSDDIRKAAASLGAEIKVGFLSGRNHKEAPMETCELARILHFGTATIPARPFLEEGIENAEGKIRKDLEKELDKVTAGGTPDWAVVGRNAVSAVQQFVNSDYYKNKTPNSPETIRRKSTGKGKNLKIGDLPLVDTKELMNSLSFIVEKK